MEQMLKKICAIGLLLMLSMGTMAKVDVRIEKFTGGTITATQGDEIGGDVTVTLTVTPDRDYIISKSDISVYATISPSETRGDTPEISGKLTLKGDDPKDLSEKRDYTVTVGANFGVWVKEANFSNGSKGPNRNTSISFASDITDMSGSYTLASDFECDATIGTSDDPFTGTIDGGLVTIEGTWDRPLFGCVDGAVIKNVIIKSVNVSYAGNAGAIAAVAKGNTRIFNCGILDGTVGGNDDVGGVVGQLDGSARVINCFSYADITGGNNVGGIVGNNKVTTTADNIATMVMNCMFYGDITSGATISPVYGGTNINNLQGGLNTFNYYRYESHYSYVGNITAGKYNCALAVEEKYLTRFEFYRQLLNSNKKLAAFYATGNAADADQMAKWVLETADRSNENPKPYPVLKPQGYYPSIINYDVTNAPDSATVGRNKGGKLGKTLSVTILTKSQKTDGGQSWPTAASSDVHTTSLTLTRTDKDEDRFNFNYDKVQLPYYNDVGTGNYTENRAVTGWKITAITAVNGDPYTKDNYPTSGIKDYPDHNYADRKSSNKDLYTVSKRVFSQGAYFDVPYGVSSITIEPYWGKATYIADKNYDVVYKNDYTGKQNVANTGTQAENNTTLFNNQKIQITVSGGLDYIDKWKGGLGSTVYDNAIVLVGNIHQDGVPSNGDNPFTLMSVDNDNDHEPDYSMIYHHKDRLAVAPIRFDFLNVIGTAQAQKPNGATLICNVGIFATKGWFEITNTALIYFTQFEYENLTKAPNKFDAPLILHGGLYDQFVSTQSSSVSGKTIYIHLGGNVWVKEFGMGTHSDGEKATPHVPVSVTGGDYDGFYLSGTYKPDAAVNADNAECYISSGHFGEIAGASQEQINGNVRWQIYNADIDNFFGGGTNADKPIKGDVIVDIYNSRVSTFCGGPKFGNMEPNKKVTTNAVGCVFEKFFGAGYGGTSYSRKKYYDNTTPKWDTELQKYYTTDRGKYFDGITNGLGEKLSNGQYKFGYKGVGVATDFDYEFFVWSKGQTGGRFYVKFASFSLAQCNDVSSTLTRCTINGNFYGGGSLGKVTGTATSILDGCTVYGNVFGGGYSATLPEIPVRNAGFTKIPKFNSASGMFEPAELSDTTHYEWKHVDNLLDNGVSGIDENYKYVYTDVDLTALGQVANTDLTIKGNTFVQGKIVDGKATGGVFGGGDESKTNGNTTVTIENTGEQTVLNVFGGGNVADVGGGVTVNIQGGTVANDVYGGGALADTNTDNTTDTSVKTTLVNLTGGTVNGNVYGGGLGSIDVTNIETGDVITPGQEALVKGDVLVKLNGTPTEGEGGAVSYNDKCVVKGSVFGCNNQNGSPKGSVEVHVYKTWGAEKTTPENLDVIDDNLHKYHLAAVYGGGNLAAYVPNNLETGKTHVIIDGCDLTSIRQVYGGGNAASTPATLVDVNGNYEIEEVFGGGNGKDRITVNGVQKDNPGANVGFYDYSAVEDTYNTKEKRQEEEFKNTYTFGSGAANVNIVGGRIHRVYGGSNTKGNVRVAAITMLEDQNVCDFHVDQAYGGGKSAPMDGKSELRMSCMPGLKVAYGGAEEADINEDVVLTITNGNYDRVFGGNNVRGKISGNITVNIEETGCNPVLIKQLYGGGNQAPYSGKITVNVKSFTSIGDIFGGGYGKTATVTGDTEVNVDVCKGRYESYIITSTDSVGTQEFSFTQYKRADDGGFVPDLEHRETEDVTETVYLPPHPSHAIGAINNVYGGGNEAKVVGNTSVNIGTKSKVTFASIADNPETEAKENEKDVEGVKIVGNVYGGGNNAEVTGNTNVTIGESH
jgi:hypothetical protein